MSYYDITVTQIPVGTGDQAGVINIGTEGERECFPVEVTQHELAWWDEVHKKVGSECYLSLQDNGSHGDGVTASIFVGDDTNEIVRFHIPDNSLDTIIQALTAIRRLRDSE